MQKTIPPKLNKKGVNSRKKTLVVKIFSTGYQRQFGTPVTKITMIVSCAVIQERRDAASSATLPELMGHVTAMVTSSVKQVNYVHQH